MALLTVAIYRVSQYARGYGVVFRSLQQGSNDKATKGNRFRLTGERKLFSHLEKRIVGLTARHDIKLAFN